MSVRAPVLDRMPSTPLEEVTMEILHGVLALLGGAVLGVLAAATVLAIISFVADLLPSKDDDQ